MRRNRLPSIPFRGRQCRGNVTQSLLFRDRTETLAAYAGIGAIRQASPSEGSSAMLLDSAPGEGKRSPTGCTLKVVRVYSASVHREPGDQGNRGQFGGIDPQGRTE